MVRESIPLIFHLKLKSGIPINIANNDRGCHFQVFSPPFFTTIPRLKPPKTTFLVLLQNLLEDLEIKSLIHKIKITPAPFYTVRPVMAQKVQITLWRPNSKLDAFNSWVPATYTFSQLKEDSVQHWKLKSRAMTSLTNKEGQPYNTKDLVLTSLAPPNHVYLRVGTFNTAPSSFIHSTGVFSPSSSPPSALEG